MDEPDPPLQIDHHVFDEDELVQLSFLRDEETDALITARLLNADVRLNSPLNSEVIFALPELSLHITAGALYPVQSPTWRVENKSLPRERADALRRRLRDIVAEAETERNTLARWESREEGTEFGIFEPVMVVLQLAQAAREHIDAFRSDKSAAATNGCSAENDKHIWFLDCETTKAAVDIGQLDTLTLRETAYNLLQMSPAQIANYIPGHFRVLHVEQVLRSDLAQDLRRFQDRLRRTLSGKSADKLRHFMPPEIRGSRRVEDMIDHLVRPRITFHGTQRQNVPGIVRHGFIGPGRRNPDTGAGHEVRCGSTYGRGIYSSPSADFALSYCQSWDGQAYRPRRTGASEYHGMKLVVCATVMGRSRLMFREDRWWQEDAAYEDFDSHVGNDNLEYIVFDQAQCIPVYVVHLDWGADNAEYFRHLPSSPQAWAAATSNRRMRTAEARLTPQEMLPGDRKRAKEAVFARAAKWFPYGFGPAAGTRFVVEEVGDVSEDEEEYGEYQALRGDEDEDGYGQGEKDFWAWVKVAAVEEYDEDEAGLGKVLEGTHLADEYGDARKALRVPLGYHQKTADWDEMARPGSEAALEKAARTKQDDGFHLELLMREEEES